MIEIWDPDTGNNINLNEQQAFKDHSSGYTMESFEFGQSPEGESLLFSVHEREPPMEGAGEGEGVLSKVLIWNLKTKSLFVPPVTFGLSSRIKMLKVHKSQFAVMLGDNRVRVGRLRRLRGTVVTLHIREAPRMDNMLLQCMNDTHLVTSGKTVSTRRTLYVWNIMEHPFTLEATLEPGRRFPGRQFPSYGFQKVSLNGSDLFALHRGGFIQRWQRTSPALPSSSSAKRRRVSEDGAAGPV